MVVEEVAPNLKPPSNKEEEEDEGVEVDPAAPKLNAIGVVVVDVDAVAELVEVF